MILINVFINILNNFKFSSFVSFRTHNLSERSLIVLQLSLYLLKLIRNVNYLSLLGFKSKNVDLNKHCSLFKYKKSVFFVTNDFPILNNIKNTNSKDLNIILLFFPLNTHAYQA